jgi:hypothetical protein
MISQERFVTACKKYYARNGLEPGNPFHGKWHKAHYPLPECLGGIEWVWLLKHHHAIQGIIQSEEMQYRCIFGWEIKLLPKYYLPYGEKWRKVIPPKKRRKAKAEFSEWHKLTWSLLLEELQERIDANPYPGQTHRLLKLAHLLIPAISKREWAAIFRWFDITNKVVGFPVKSTGVNIDHIETQLLALANGHDTIPASSLEKVMRFSPISKKYRDAKTQLQKRGWKWSRARLGGAVHRVICVPR